MLHNGLKLPAFFPLKLMFKAVILHIWTGLIMPDIERREGMLIAFPEF